MQLTESQNAQFTTDGFTLVKDALPADVLARASAAIDEIYSKPERSNGILSYFEEPSLFELLQHPNLERIAQHILGTDEVILNSSSILFKRPQEGVTEHKVEFEHVDIMYSVEEFGARPRQQMCMLMVMVDDLPVGRGNTFVRPGSHRQIAEWNKANGQEPVKAHPTPFDKLPALPYADPIPVVAEAGDVVPFCTCVIHGASTNIDTKPRKIMFVNFCEMGRMKAMSGNHNRIEQRTKWRDMLRESFRPERKHLLRDSEA